MVSKIVDGSSMRSMAPSIISLTVSTVVSATSSFVGLLFLARALEVTELGQIVFAQASASIDFCDFGPPR